MRLKCSPKKAQLEMDKLVGDGINFSNSLRKAVTSSLLPSFLDEQDEWESFHKWCVNAYWTVEEIFISPAFASKLKLILDQIIVLRRGKPYEGSIFQENYRELYALATSMFQAINEISMDLEGYSRSPLFYLNDHATIYYYDVLVELQKGSNEGDVCERIFMESIGKNIEVNDLCTHVFGFGNEDKQKEIGNAVEGINKKTKKAFGFKLISKNGSRYKIELPTQLLKAVYS